MIHAVMHDCWHARIKACTLLSLDEPELPRVLGSVVLVPWCHCKLSNFGGKHPIHIATCSQDPVKAAKQLPDGAGGALEDAFKPPSALDTTAAPNLPALPHPATEQNMR